MSNTLKELLKTGEEMRRQEENVHLTISQVYKTSEDERINAQLATFSDEANDS
jgi:hypothetical protein